MNARRTTTARTLRALALLTVLLLLPNLDPHAEVDDAIDQAQDYPRIDYVWPYATGPTYGVEGLSRVEWARPGMLHTAVGSFDLSRGLPELPAKLTAYNRLAEREHQYFVLQVHPDSFGTGAFEELRGYIERRGGEFLEAMAVGGFLVRLNSEAFAEVAGERSVLALFPYHPALKLSPSIGRTPLPDPDAAVSRTYRLRVLLFRGEDAEAAAAEIAALGGEVVDVWADLIHVELHRDRLAALASVEAVKRVFEDLPVFAESEETTTTLQTGRWNQGATPYHLNGVDGGGDAAGAEEILMVVDTGAQLDDGDLSMSRNDACVTPGTQPGTTQVTLDACLAGGHRKVLYYTTTNAFGGAGNFLGCDGSNGYSHGQVVSATALGNATDVAAAYGTPWWATDKKNNRWKLDGVAPKAKLLFYDCDADCNRGLFPGNEYTRGAVGIAAGFLPDGYDRGARVVNFSWGRKDYGDYNARAQKADEFLYDRKDSMLFTSAGNSGWSLASNTITPPATSKNAIVVGASYNANDTGTGGLFFSKPTNPEDRAEFSSIGPATPASQRIAPLLMAPGKDSKDAFGTFPITNMGPVSEFTCASPDNNSSTPVKCTITDAHPGTSYASPAAAGTAMLVRDYFRQGFYPDGTDADSDNNVDRVPNISGALVKAVLVASADFMTGSSPPNSNMTEKHRFNNQQGYGRIQLDHVLPLTNWARSAPGLVVVDGVLAVCQDDETEWCSNNQDCLDAGLSGPCVDRGVNSTSLPGIAQDSPTPETYSFHVKSDTKQLRVACAWIEDGGETLTNDLDIELVAPDGSSTYYGNFFDEDQSGNNVVSAGEDCDGDSKRDLGAWSIAVTASCPAITHDAQNPTEAIFLSPDPAGNGIADNAASAVDESADNQIQAGDWTLKIFGSSVPAAGGQRYACAIAGETAAALGSKVRFDESAYSCNGRAVIEVIETDDVTDPAVGLTPPEVSGRVKVQVLDESQVVVDEETNLTFQQPSPLYFKTDEILLTDATFRSPAATWDNGVLDVRSDETIRVIYADESGGVPLPVLESASSAVVQCKVGLIVERKNWFDPHRLPILGGCERITLPVGDRFNRDDLMDAGESVLYPLLLQSSETQADLKKLKLTLRCVETDTDSPFDCRPGSDECVDPDRENNQDCEELGWMTISGSTASVPLLSPGDDTTVWFPIRVHEPIPGTPKIEILLRASATRAGLPVERLFVVARHKLDVDEEYRRYSTNWPFGGRGPAEVRDYNNNEEPDDPNVSLDPDLDLRFDTITWSDLTATGGNLDIHAPWNFDTDDGGFTAGLHEETDYADITDTIANWSEDTNFNGALDGTCACDPAVACTGPVDCFNACGTPVCLFYEDRDPVNGQLDSGWSTRGGCGWQTLEGGQLTGGVWHTGRIGDTTGDCLVLGIAAGQCQAHETISGTGDLEWIELLKTPIVQKVNQIVDSDGDPLFHVEFLQFSWNMSLDLADENAIFAWALDTDTENPTTLDLDTLPSIRGPFGAVTGGDPTHTEGFPMFAPLDGAGFSVNGTLGNNRGGKNACFFEGPGVSTGPYQFPGPPDDDLDDDSDMATDEYVTAEGPIRNAGAHDSGGPETRRMTMENSFGPAGDSFRGVFAFGVRQGASGSATSGFGVTLDDVVLEWNEIELVKDTTTCDPGSGGGVCAILHAQMGNVYGGAAVLDLWVDDRYAHHPTLNTNDCDLDGSFAGPLDDNDCNNNSIEDVVVRAVVDSGRPEIVDSEIVVLDLTETADLYRGGVLVSTGYDTSGVLYVAGAGTQPATIRVQYDDLDDGSGNACPNNADPAKVGLIEATTEFSPSSSLVVVQSFRLSDNGDDDGYADTNETVEMFITVSNKTGRDLHNVVARLMTNSPNIDCVIRPVITIGSLLVGESKEGSEGFALKVSPSADRSSVEEDLSATFAVSMSADDFDALLRPQSVTLDLDLDVSGGGVETTFLEGFEGAGLGQFTDMRLDEGYVDNVSADGLRCQYSDPDFSNSNSYSEPECFPGFANPSNNDFDWHAHGTSSPDGGRAFEGTESLHFGIHPLDASRDTTRLRQLDAVRLDLPIALAHPGIAVTERPELRFKQQVSFMDDLEGVPDGETADRGIVQVQLADASGSPVGNWVTIHPYHNIYDAQPTDKLSNCMFDPTDDGNNEDDYLMQDDPLRRLGPSSTCYSGFVFGRQGNTDWRVGFDPDAIGRASDGPGLEGSVGPGTWVETKFDLSRFAGRRIRIRLLASTVAVGNVVDYIALGRPSDDVKDDGWYIDDVQVVGALTTPSDVNVDVNDNSGLQSCGSTCDTITAILVADPATLGAPAHVTKLNASGSSANRCLDGVLQYQFWIDEDGNGTLGDPGDTVLCDWSDDPICSDAPDETTDYGVVVRCATAPATCIDDSLVTVIVDCPVHEQFVSLFGDTIRFDDKQTLSWATVWMIDAVRGDLAALRASATFNGTTEICLAENETVDQVQDGSTPSSNQAWYYLVREQPDSWCNVTMSWGTGRSEEIGNRDGQLGADPDRCN